MRVDSGVDAVVRNGGAKAAPPPPPQYGINVGVLPGQNSATMTPNPIPDGADAAWVHVTIYGKDGWHVLDSHLEAPDLVMSWQRVSKIWYKGYYDGMNPGGSFALKVHGTLTRPGPRGTPPEFWLTVQGTLAEPPYYVLPPKAVKPIHDKAEFTAYYLKNPQKSTWSSHLEGGQWQSAGQGASKKFSENVAGWYEIKAEHASEPYSDTASLAFVALEQLLTGWWYPVQVVTQTEPAYVAAGTEAWFGVFKTPSGADWPAGKPVWTATGDAQIRLYHPPDRYATFITFPEPCEKLEQPEWIDVECGNTLQGKVIVAGCEFEETLAAQYATWVAAGHPGTFTFRIKLRPTDLSGYLSLGVSQSGVGQWARVVMDQAGGDLDIEWDGAFSGGAVNWLESIQARVSWQIRAADGSTLVTVVDREDLYPQFLDLDIDTNGDGQVTDADEPGELSPGAFLGVNDDDDNHNGTPDKDELGAVTGEDDLRNLVIQKVVPDGFAGTLTLRFSNNVAVYAGSDRTGPVPARQTFTQADLPKPLWVEGKSPGTATISISASGGGEVKVTATVVGVDLDVDSDNNGSVTDADDAIEDAASGTGKIVLANTLDSTANDVPDFADGIDRNGNSGSGRATGFVPFTLTIPSPVDLNVAKLKVTYSAADPAAVTASGDPIVYAAGSAGSLRLWTKDGVADRKVAGVNASTSGDYIPPGEYEARKLITTGNTVTLCIEGINRSDPQTTRILVELDPTGHAGYVAKDAVRCTVATLDLDFRDVTGIDWPSGPSVNTPRVPADSEVDGAACDRLIGVDDGTALLVRAIGSPALYNAASPPVAVSFGYLKKDVSPVVFAALPGDLRREGRFKELTPDDEAFLATLPLEKKGEVVGDPVAPGHRVVIAAMKYEPPYELDVNDTSNKNKDRNLPLAIDVTGKVTGHGSRPHRITLVRPPLVLVHGINSSYRDSFLDSGWTAKFEEDFGFVCQRADHSNIPVGLDGNGDIHDAFVAVKDASFTAARKMREGTSFANKLVACQKCDIVAHSYGGLLSRWYTEKSPDYPTRRNVRKIITMGTSHRGAVVCNMMCATYKKQLFFEAELGESVGNLAFANLGDLLNKLNTGWGVLPVVRWRRGGNPPDPTTEDQIVPALQVMAVQSEVLGELNLRPFDKEVAYAAIVGTDEGLLPGGVLNCHTVLEPRQITAGPSYFPWYSGLDGGNGQSDAIVPVWSQDLPAMSVRVRESHSNYKTNSTVREQVRQWLNDVSLPRGLAHRSDFLGAAIPDGASRANAYVGSHLSSSGESVGADVETEAIVRVVEVKSAHPTADFDASNNTLGSKGGLITFVCTGMVPDASRTLTIATAGGAELQKNVPIPFSGIDGVLTSFTVEATRIGRTKGADIIGPDGRDSNLFGIGGATWNVGYAVGGASYGGWSGMKSPHVVVEFPAYELPTPEGTSPVPPLPGNPFKVTGGAPCTGSGGGTQSVRVLVKHRNGFPVDPILVDATFNTPVPAEAFADVLIPYESSAPRLFKDDNGYVAGVNGTSGEKQADIYQELVTPGWTPNPKSSTVKVKAAP